VLPLLTGCHFVAVRTRSPTPPEAVRLLPVPAVPTKGGVVAAAAEGFAAAQAWLVFPNKLLPESASVLKGGGCMRSAAAA